MDVVMLSRLQFAVTVFFHFIFVPLTLGLVVLLAIMETLYVRTEGHGFYTEANQRTYYTQLLDFLSRHLGGAKAK